MEQSSCKPMFAPDVHLKFYRKRLFEEDSVKLEHSFGYQCSDGTNLCSLDMQKIIVAAGRYSMIFDVNEELQSFHQTILGQGITRIVVHPNRKHFAVAEKAGKVRVYIYSYPEMVLYKTLNDDSTKESCHLMAFQSSGELLITISGYPENKLTLWKWRKETEVLSSVASKWRVFSVSFSTAKPNVFSTCGEHEIKFWKLKKDGGSTSFEMVESKYLDEYEGQSVQHSIHLPNEVFLAGSRDGYLLFWKGVFDEVCLSEKMGRKGDKPCHQGSILEILLMGDFLITLGSDGWVYLWSYKVVARRLRLMGDEEAKYLELDPLDQIKVSDFAQLIHGVPSLTEKLEKIWYMQDIGGSIWQVDISAKRENNPPKQILKGPGDKLAAMDNCKEYPLVAVCSGTGLITISNCTTKTEVCSMHCSTGATCLLWPSQEFDGAGASILVGFEDGTLRWMVLSGYDDHQNLYLKSVQKPHTAPLICMSLNSTQTILATYGNDYILFFFKVIEKSKFLPIGFYTLDAHLVQWMTWIKKPKEFLNQEETETGELEATEDLDLETRNSETDEIKRINELVQREPSMVYESFNLNLFVEEEMAFPPAPESEPENEIQNNERDDDKIQHDEIHTDSDKSNIEDENGKFSDSSTTSSTESSPYEEEKRAYKTGGTKKKQTEDEVSMQSPSTEQNGHRRKTIFHTFSESEVSKIKKEKFENEILDAVIIENLLLCCKGSYLMEVDPPNEKHHELLKNRRTFHIPYDSAQIYKVGVFESFHELGDRVYDSEDEEHPNRSKLVKKYFLELKYAEKQTIRRRKRREQNIGKQKTSPEVLTWVQSDKLGHLWLSLGEYDYGYLFECPFVRDADGDHVDLKPVRAVELLTSERMSVMSLCMSPCGEFIFLGQQDGHLSVCRLEKKFDISTGYDFAKYPLHDSLTGSIVSTKMTPDGNFVLTAGLDGNVFLASFNVSTTQKDVGFMRKPLSILVQKDIVIADSDALSIEETLAKDIRLEIMDKVTDTLSKLDIELPILKIQYQTLKCKFKNMNTMCNRLPTASTFRLNTDLGPLGAHPKCIAAFHKITKHIMENVGSKYRDAIAQWGSYLSKLQSAFNDTIEEPIVVRNFMTDESVQSYVECRMPHGCRRRITEYNKDAFEYEKCVLRKHKFIPNTKTLEKLHASLDKTKNDLMQYPEDMKPVPENIIKYNNRKMEKIRSIIQRKRFEEENPNPTFDEEDEYYLKRMKEIEERYFRLKSDPNMKNYLPKTMNLNPEQKKEQIILYLNKMRRLWHPYNVNVAKLGKMLKSIEQWNLGLGKKEQQNQERKAAEGSIENVKSVAEVIEGMTHAVVDYTEIQTNLLLTEAESTSIASSNYAASCISTASHTENIHESSVDALKNLFKEEFCDDECYYNPTHFRHQPVAYSSTETLDYIDVDVSYPHSIHTSTYIDVSDEKLGAENVKKCEMDGIPVYIAVKKKGRRFPKKMLTKDYCFDYEGALDEEDETHETNNKKASTEIIHDTNFKYPPSNANKATTALALKHSWENLKSEIMANSNISYFSSNISRRKSSPRSQVCSSTLNKVTACENNNPTGNNYFLGIREIIKEEEQYEKTCQEAELLANRMTVWKYFNNFHRIMVILKYKLDCEKKYQDLVHNIQCRELNIIKQSYPDIKSRIDRISKEEDNIQFECVKLELLEKVLAYTKKQEAQLKSHSQNLYQNFMNTLGKNHKHSAFFEHFFTVKPKVKAKKIDNTAPTEQDGVSKNEEEHGEQEKDKEEEVEGKEEEEEEQKEEIEEMEEEEEGKKEEEVQDEDEEKNKDLFDENIQAKLLKVNMKLLHDARTIRQEIIELEVELQSHKTRLERIENKKQFLIKRVKNMRGIISEIIPEVKEIYSLMKSKLDKQKLHGLLYARRIECDYLPQREKYDFDLHSKNIMAQLNVANDVVETAVKNIEKMVIGTILRELGRVARNIIVHKTIQRSKSKTKMDVEKPIGNIEDILPLSSSTTKLTEEVTATDLKPIDDEMKIAMHDELYQPEPEGKINIKEIIKTGIRNYEDYSQISEGDYLAFPIYFMYPVMLKDQNDINTYQEMKQCINQIISNIEKILNNNAVFCVREIMSKMVHKVSVLTEATVDINSKPKTLLQEEEDEPVNPGGGLLYELAVLSEMERDDPQKYKYTDLFRKHVEEVKVTKEREASIDSVTEDHVQYINFDQLTNQQIIISKGIIDELKNLHQYLYSAFKSAERKCKQEAMCLLKLKTINQFLERFSLIEARFQMKERMASKLGRELNLEMFLDTLENPHYYIAKHELDKKLAPIRREAQIKQKAISIQKSKKEQIIYATNLLWIECGRLQTELDNINANTLKKRKALPKKARNQSN